LIRKHPLPDRALLAANRSAGGYADCYTTGIARPVSHAEYVEAFYTTWLFKLERLVLEWLVAKPSTDVEAQQLARGQRESFAAWTVEGRAPDQLLMCDFQQKTRSWLMVETEQRDGTEITHLYFGTGIAPVADKRTGAKSLSVGFRALLGFHKLYSRALLGAARARLNRRRSA
jgi:hypothetical protein